MSNHVMKGSCISLLFIFFLTGFVFLMNAVVTAQSQTIVKIGEVKGVVGQTITVPVLIENPNHMAGGKAEIIYDPEIVELLGVNESELLSGAMFMPNLELDDRLIVAWIGLKSTTTDGEMFEISFKLKEKGKTTLVMQEITLADSLAGDINTLGVNGQVVVSENGTADRSDPIADNGARETVPGSHEDTAEREQDATGTETGEENAIRPGAAILSIGNVQGAVGDTVTVEVKIENPSGMAGGNLVLSYDPEMVEPKNVKTGDLLSGLIPISNLEYSENSLSIAWFGLTGKTSDGLVAEITFLLKEEGQSSLELKELSLVNANGEDIEVEGVNGSIVIGETGTSIPGIADTGIQYIYIIIGVVILAVGVLVFLLIRRGRGKKKDIFNIS